MPPENHRATVDANGNIILLSEGTKSRLTRAKVNRIPTLWSQVTKLIGTISSKGTSAATHAVSECKNQIRSSAQELNILESVSTRSFREHADALWGILSQPGWVPRRKKPPKVTSRGWLFISDVFRFGATFAVLFVGLFAAMNYQSFWQMTAPYLNPVASIQRRGQLEGHIDQTLRNNLLKSPSLSVAGSEHALIAHLPPVGPPDNRIVIPKLSLNVPLVSPDYAALLNEDWEQLETDIQTSLKDGVVHYPGTARPGQAGNFFVTGHSSYYPWAPGKYKTVFARLHELDVGDEYWVYYGGDKYRYRIQSKEEVRPTNVAVLDQPINRRVSTLMTCTPAGTTLRRLILKSEEIDPVTGIAMEVGSHRSKELPAIKAQVLPI